MQSLNNLFVSLLTIIICGQLVAVLPAETAAQQSPANTLQFDSTLYHDLDFRAVGPTRGGRVTAVEGHRWHPHTFYMGGAGGSGLWKTTNYGNSWTNISDGKGFKSTSIGAIEVADSDSSIIYVGTGTDGIRSNVTTGAGVYKSTDAGKKWSFLGLEEAGQIGAVKAHPENPDRVYVAALGHVFGNNKQRGVFRSLDGGESWENVLFLSDSTGAVDLELNPENPDEIYVAMWRAERKPWTIISGADKEDGLYKSTDGGDNWKKLEEGLPQGLIGKVNIAVTPADPDRLYALVEAPEEQEGLYRSNDRGESWELINTSPGIMTRPFYFTNITAHPTDPDKIYVGNVRYWVSTDSGENFERRNVTHADVHDLWINPDHPDIQIQGNDGGATVTLDGGKTWSTQLNQPTAELYQVNVDNQFPYWLYAGQQDNSTIAVPSLPPAESAENPTGHWHMIGGCETGPAVPRLDNAAIVYANCKGRFGRYNKETGQEKNFWVGAQYMYGRNPSELKYRFQRVAPIEVSPHNSNVVYHGSQYLHRTNNGGRKWTTISPDLTANKQEFQVPSGRPITRDITGEEHFSTLYSIQVSPHASDVIWTGANDGPVHITRDGGKTWSEVTPEGLPPNGRVDAIEPSPHKAGTAYIAVERRKLDDFTPYIYKTNNYGKSWTLLTTGENGIPDGYPTRVVREDPSREGLLYAGTDFGLFVSFDDGNSWQSLQFDLPNTPITDIRIHKKDLVLSTMGRSFWILDNLTVLHQLDRQIARKIHHLYTPKDAYRMNYRSGGSKVPQYIGPGVMIDFYLAEAPENPVVIDILKKDGTILRRFIGTSKSEEEKDEKTTREPNMMAPGQQIPGTPDTVSVRAGHNRFTWNMRYKGKTVAATHSDTYFGVNVGPLAVPDTYKVRVSKGNWNTTQPFEILMDPRVTRDGVSQEDLQLQLEINLQIRNTLGRANRIAAEIDTVRFRYKESMEDSSQKDETLDRLNILYRELVTSDKGSYPPPMLIDQIEYLYFGMIDADQHPGEEARNRIQELTAELEDIQQRWKALQEKLDS